MNDIPFGSSTISWRGHLAGHRVLPVGIIFALATGCGTIRYEQPSAGAPPPGSNTAVLNGPYDQVWSQAIPRLGKSFYVINNIDKASGILNITYSGDPELYVDCGNVHSEYGAQKFDIPAAKANASWVCPSGGLVPAQCSQKVSLDGRMNIIFEKANATSTTVTVNARYVVTKTVMVQFANNRSRTVQVSATFNTGGSGSFDFAGGNSVCRPTGKFEHDILVMIAGQPVAQAAGAPLYSDGGATRIPTETPQQERERKYPAYTEP